MSTQVTFHHHEDDGPIVVYITDHSAGKNHGEFRSLSLSFHESGVKQEVVFLTRIPLEELLRQFPTAEVARG